MADKKWFRCELRSRDGDELLGYFITQAEKADGPDGSAAEVYYDLFDECGCPAKCYHGELKVALEEVVECEDPTIPNDYARTELLRKELTAAVERIKALDEERKRLYRRFETVRAEPDEELTEENNRLMNQKRVAAALLLAAQKLLEQAEEQL